MHKLNILAGNCNHISCVDQKRIVDVDVNGGRGKGRGHCAVEAS